MWTWVAIGRLKMKLIITWRLGKRARQDAYAFIGDLASRIVSERVQVTTDGSGIYNEPLERLFGRADYGTEVKVYGRPPYESVLTQV